MTDIEVGPATDAERFLRTDTVVWFQESLSAPVETQLRGLPADQRFAAEIDGADASTYPGVCGVYPLELSVPGGDLLPCAGLTWVGVHPDHRRRGVLTAMLRHHFEQVRDTAGTPVSALHASEAAVQVALEGIQALGGNGYINEFATGRILRDAKLYAIGAGTNEIRRMLIGRELFYGNA